MKALLQGQRGGIGILLNVLLVALILFVGYQFWVNKQRTPLSISLDPTTSTGQGETPAGPALTTVTESVDEAAPKPHTQPSFQEQVPSTSPIIQAQLNPTERPAVEAPAHQPVQVPVRPLQLKEVKKSDAFADASRQIPMLLVSRMAPNAIGMYSAQPGALFVADIVVSHDPTGKGQVATDGPYGQSVLSSLHTAV